MNLVKDTTIKYLCIPNTTYLDSASEEPVIFNRVYHLKFIYNFMMPDVNLSQKLIITFPNIRVLDLEQIQLNTKSAELLISLINDYNNNLKQIILNKEESNAKHIIQQIQIDKLDFIKNINDSMLKVSFSISNFRPLSKILMMNLKYFHQVF